PPKANHPAEGQEHANNRASPPGRSRSTQNSEQAQSERENREIEIDLKLGKVARIKSDTKNHRDQKQRAKGRGTPLWIAEQFTVRSQLAAGCVRGAQRLPLFGLLQFAPD